MKNILKIKINEEMFKGYKCITNNRLKISYSLISDQKENPDNWHHKYASGTYYNTNKFIRYIHRKILNTKEFKKLTLFRGVNTFQFLPSHVYPLIFFNTQLVEVLDYIFKKLKPRYLIYEKFYENEYSDIWNNTLFEYSKKYNIKLIKSDKKIISFNALKSILKLEMKSIGIAYIVRNLKRSVISLSNRLFYFNLIREMKKKNNDIIIFFTLGKRYWNYDSINKTFDDSQFSKIIESLKVSEKFNFIIVDLENSSLKNLRLRNKLNKKCNNEIWINYNYFVKPIFFILRFFLIIKSRFYLYKKSLYLFKKILIYKQINIFNSLAKTLKYSIFDFTVEAEQELITASNLLSVIKPKYIFTSHETHPFPRSVIIESSRNKIPTIGLQHGLIGNQHYDYMHYRVTNMPILNPYHFAIPLKTAVWGNLWKDTLVNYGNYKSEFLAVTGNWKLDKNKLKILKKERKNSKVSNLGIILTLWQTLSYENIVCIFDSIKGKDNLNLLIKLHPAETIQNKIKIESLLEKYGYKKNQIFEGSIDEFFYNVDLVISEYSSAMLESVLFGKRTILLNIDKFKKIPQFFQKFDVIEVATNRKEFFEIISSSLSGKSLDNQFIVKRNRFINETFFNTDFKATQRLIDIIPEIESKI